MLIDGQIIDISNTRKVPTVCNYEVENIAIKVALHVN